MTSENPDSKMDSLNSTQSTSDLTRISGHIYSRRSGWTEEKIEEQWCIDGRVLDEEGFVITDNDDDEQRLLQMRVVTKRRLVY